MARYATRSISKAGGNRAGAIPRSRPISSLIRDDYKNANIVHKNRMLLLQLEQRGILAPGVVTINGETGELNADLSREEDQEEPDTGTMAGLFPNQSTSEIDEQIPSWLRDYLVSELDVYGCGPPTACAAFYDHLKKSQDDVGINTSVRTAQTLLRCATMSLRHSVQDIQEFVDTGCMVDDTYELEVGTIVRTVQRLVASGEDKRAKNKTPQDIQLLLDIGSMGVVMKSAMEASLRSLVVEPYGQLVEKLDMVAKGLEERESARRKEAEGEGEEKSEREFGSDSGVDGC